MRDLFQLIGFIARLSKGIRLSRLSMVVIGILGIVSGAAQTGMVALINSIINQAATPERSRVVLFVALCVTLPLCRFFSSLLLINLTNRSLLELRVRLSHRILGAPLRGLEMLGPSRLVATLTQDIGTIVDTIGLLPILTMHVAIVASCLAYLGWLSPKLLLQIAGIIVFGILSYQIPVVRAMSRFVRARTHYDALVKQIRAMTEGTKELKMHRGRRHALLGQVSSTTSALQNEVRVGSIIYTLASSWGQVLFFVVVGLLVLVLPRYESLSPAMLIGYTLVLFQMMGPLEMLLNSFPLLSRSSVAAKKVEELGLSLNEDVREKEGTGPVVPGAGWKQLQLAGVCHTYRRENEDETFQLGPIDLTFEPGELVFIVGGNGSGKTTLAKMMIGLYAPEAGELRIDGVPVTDDTREQYREHFSAVFSDFFVFEELLGLEGVKQLDENARRYLQQLHLNQKVKVENGVLSTIELSQGQRKRLALLTAYLEDRPIYLFDEWAADQDPIFKEIFYLEILPELRARNKTVFVISHDDRYFHVADRILKLDYGKIASDRSMAEFLESLEAAGVAAPRPLRA